MATTVIDINKLLDIDPYNGKPVIRGSRLRVITLAGLHHQGLAPEEIATQYPDLSVPAVYAALAYYYDHKEEMDAQEEREMQESLAWAKDHGAEIL